MTVSDSFDHFRHAVGLDRLAPTRSRSIHLDSSYDFERNMAVVVASDMPDPRNRDAYLASLEKLLYDVHIAMGGSTLTLFTNRRDMQANSDQLHAKPLPFRREELPVRAQGVLGGFRRRGGHAEVRGHTQVALLEPE